MVLMVLSPIVGIVPIGWMLIPVPPTVVVRWASPATVVVVVVVLIEECLRGIVVHRIVERLIWCNVG